MVSVTSASRYVTSASRYHPRYQSRSSMYTSGLIPRNFRLEPTCVHLPLLHLSSIFPCFTLVNVYVDLVVFTRIAGTSYTGSGRYCVSTI